jgi:glutamate dehydrogenase
MLTAKVDLLFNGGVGTYVKSSIETNEEAGDRGNYSLRVDAKDLRAFAVCEGGNLGFTQKGRVEYSLNGGKINLDGIDNSAGVNTSDHEVNIKILLSRTDMSESQKREVLKLATDEVLKLVLQSNFNQALGLSLDEYRYKNEDINNFKQVVNLLESELPQFKRKYFAIPSEDNFNLSRPNLSFLFSYSKILVKKILLKAEDKNSILQTFYASEHIIDYFPESFRSYKNEILSHPLKREIMATVIADRVINYGGITFLNLLLEIGEDEFRETIGRYLRVEKLVNADKIRMDLDQNIDYSKFIKFEKELLNLEQELKEFSNRER